MNRGDILQTWLSEGDDPIRGEVRAMMEVLNLAVSQIKATADRLDELGQEQVECMESLEWTRGFRSGRALGLRQGATACGHLYNILGAKIMGVDLGEESSDDRAVQADE